MEKVVERRQRNAPHQAALTELARTHHSVWDGVLQAVTEVDAAALTPADQPDEYA